MDCNLNAADDSNTQYCKADEGEFEGCEFDDSISVDFEFSDDLSEEDQQAIKDAYYDGGAGWIYDGEHEWQEEDSYVVVAGPYKVDFCDENGDVIREVRLRTKEECAKIYESTGKYASKDSAL